LRARRARLREEGQGADGRERPAAARRLTRLRSRRVPRDSRVLFGVAGWSYPDWKDVVYPRSCKDTLRAVAEGVELIKINNTFYRPPVAKNCAAWVERTRDLGTCFTAKLPQECTHERRTDAAFFAEVRQGFQPLLDSGRCLGLLAQFSYE